MGSKQASNTVLVRVTGLASEQVDRLTASPSNLLTKNQMSLEAHGVFQQWR